MANHARLDWRGRRVLDNVREASRRAINETLDEAADDARITHEWKNTPTRYSPEGGQLESEIGVDHATQRQRNPAGRFGFKKKRGFYGLFQELGTVKQRPFLALFPAADRHFPSLEERIRRILRRY